MHQATMNALEFPRIQQELASFAACQLGKELALSSEPLPSLALVRRAQQETTEAKAILAGGRSIPFGSIQDVRLQVERAEIGGVLRPEQLSAVADTIYGCRQLHRFLVEHRAEAPLIARHAAAFGAFDELEEEIRRCIERGTVSSKASRTLKQVRGEITVLEGRIQDRLQGLLKQYRQHLQEALVTSRNGRYVIPVKASARSLVPGSVHGASASGSTIFVEPEAVSQLCEELETWRAMEAAEVEQVLIGLSGLVAGQAHGLKATLGAVAELDLIFARGRLSQAWEARPVDWNETGKVDLKGARHPLLGRNAVGNHIRMGAEQRMLIVTGPNTGGKTLLLKTLGLLVIIARSGLHIPVDEGSTLCYFADVFADIGDHQSLEQSLSTFSGHIASVAPMLTQAGPNTLILLDELGSGTDPHEGTGLGIALLEAFLQRGAYTLATTHLRDIKEFGRKTPGCAYAGMGFDGGTLRPTYRLVYGTLGESHGLEIAARNGLPAAVVERARQLVYGGEAAGAVPAASVIQWTEPLPTAVRTGDPEPVAAPETGPGWEAPPAAAGAAVASTSAPLATVLAATTASRCRVAQNGSEREITVQDHVRRLYPQGLVPGDKAKVRDGQITEVANRKTVIVNRDADTQVESVVAANASQLLILISARQPDFHASVLARHLLYAERQGLTPIICLTRGDMVSPSVASEWLKPFRATGYQTLIVGSKKQGLEELSKLLTGNVTAVLGAPGSGKATILARLTGAPVPANQREDEHTDPRALQLAPDTWLIDLPGLREMGVWKPDLAGGFGDFGPFIGQCNRPGCLHRQEPGCAVRQAVEQGHVQRRRYEQYLQLLQHMRLA